MVILAVDTATKAVSAALIENGRLLGECIVHHKTMHSRNLMPLVDYLVKATGIAKTDIDVFASTIGPGSFTGIRIGVSTIKAMAYALQKPVVGINTLDCLAYDVEDSNALVCPVLDARNRQVFCAVYRRKKDHAMVRLTDYMGIPIDELMGILAAFQENVIFTGDAGEICSGWADYGFTKAVVHPGRSMPRASTVGFMAEQAQKIDPASLLPFYLRKPGAERMARLKE